MVIDRQEAARLADIIRSHVSRDFYLAQLGGFAVEDVALHYLAVGATMGLDPNPEFSTTFYLTQNADVAQAGDNPLWHYLTYGQSEGRVAKPDPDKAAVVADDDFSAQNGSILAEFFDPIYYRYRYPESLVEELSPLDHFHRLGWRRGYNPSGSFSTLDYLSRYPDVASSGLDPLNHYVRFGRSEGRPISPPPALTDDEEALRERRMRLIAPYFDEKYYLEQNEDVRHAGTSALEHYALFGWKEGRDPAAEFRISEYVGKHPRLADEPVDPFWHSVVMGSDFYQVKDPAFGSLLTLEQREAMELLEPHFDHKFYLASNRDVADAGVDPLVHYITSGWKEGRMPTPAFSPTFYLDTQPDVAAANVEPFWHYLITGKSEGRLGRHPGGWRAERLRTLAPLETEVRHWMKADGPPALLSTRALAQILKSASTTNGRQLTLSVGHDHCHRNNGGVQLCIQREEQIAKADGSSYVYVYPYQPLPRLARQSDADTIVGIVINGSDAGYAPASILAAALRRARPDFKSTMAVVHHLLGHAPESVQDLIQSLGSDSCFYWLHDYFLLCTGFTLQANDVRYCGAPPPDSNSCRLCKYGDERVQQLSRLSEFFGSLQVTVLSPSQVAADIWKSNTGLKHADLRIIEHMQLSARKTPRKKTVRAQVVTVAFSGTPADHKGWRVFEELVMEFGGDPRYEFVFFGTAEPKMRNLEVVRVNVSAENRSAMIDAIQTRDVDIVLHWASWPETFSFSTYEAVAAGSFVLTNGLSGNVARTVQKTGKGRVLKDSSDLFEAFRGNEISKLVNTRRQAANSEVFDHEISLMSYSENALGVES